MPVIVKRGRRMSNPGKITPWLCFFLFGTIFLWSSIVSSQEINCSPQDTSIGAGQKQDWTINIPKTENREVILEIQARINSDHLAGGTNALKISFNNVTLTPDFLIERKKTFTFADGRIISAYGGAGFMLYYSPDFDPIPEDNSYCPIDLPGHNPYLFRFKVTAIAKEGDNTLSIRHGAADITKEPIIINGAKIILQENEKKSANSTSASARDVPDSALPLFSPAVNSPVSYRLEITKGGGLKVDDYLIVSSFSLTPGWAELGEKSSNFDKITIAGNTLSGETPFFSLKRTVTKRSECIEVVDTFRSKAPANIPLMVRYLANIPAADRAYLGGLSPYTAKGLSSNPANPTTIVMTPSGSLGFLPLNDVFRIHIQNFFSNGLYGIADNNLVLRPGTSYTVHFAIFPSKEKDYYSQINSMRRFLGVNFEINGTFCFINARSRFLTFTNEQLATFLRNKSVKYASFSSIVVTTYKGKYAHGTAYALVDHTPVRKFCARLKQAAPDVNVLDYFHSFITTEDGAAEKYADSRVLNRDGTQADYGDPLYPIFFPTLDNSYGKAIVKYFGIVLNDIGADGIYWDEMEGTMASYHYGEPWDGYSADIDPATHQIIKLKTSVTLITQPWRTKQMDWLLAQKKPLVANGSPWTETMLKYHIPRFAETGSITNCPSGHLFTPIALGDSNTEKNEVDCYRDMLSALDYGCVYYWYREEIDPKYPTLTSYMFPITPVEIHNGYILGKERIITRKSGLFSFGDKSEVEAHFFDSEGKEKKQDLPLVVIGKRSFYKVILGDFESCALVKKGAA